MSEQQESRVSMQWLYYQICREQSKIYSKLDDEFTSLSTPEVTENQNGEETAEEVDEKLYQAVKRRAECYTRREQAAVIVITFAGMCLEAFFYDYAAEYLGDTFVERHLDKLDLRSKVLIIPKLVCGKGIDNSSHVYEKVDRLVKDRNDLVHFKSKPFDKSEPDKVSAIHDKLNQKLREGVPNGIKAIELVMKTLDTLHGKPGYYFTRVCG